MLIKQLSIFVENKPGRLVAVIDELSKNGVDISALSIADTAEYGIVRMIVNKPDLAVACLMEIGVFVKLTDVIAVTIDDTPGGLSKSLHLITDEGIEIEYMYAFVGNLEGKAVMILKVNSPEKAVELLKGTSIEVVDAKDIYRIH